MTVFGGESGHEQVGINVFTDGYDTNTPSINVYWDFYARSVNWGFADNQTLTVWGSVSGTFNFFFNVGGGIADQYVGRLTIFNQGQSYGGGPTYTVSAQISGSYLGATPGCTVSFALPAKPANVPTAPGVSVSNVTTNSAKVNVSASDGRGSAVTSYLVQVSSTSSFNSIVATLGGTGTVSGLSPNTPYWVRARAHNAVGDSAFSGTQTFTTGATVPGTPTGVGSNSITQNSANITFTAPGANGGSAITGYDVQLATDANFSVGIINKSVTASPAAVTGLVPGTKYWARVRAKNAVGAGTYSGSITLTTLTGTPTITSPAQNEQRQIALASVTVLAQGIASDRTITVEVTQDSTFATGVHTLTQNPGGASSNDQYVLSDSFYLKSGTWYARAKVTNNTSGYVTPWSPIISWTEAHIPSASVVTPTGGGTSSYVTNVPFTFRFTDAAGSGDGMTAYQLVLENNNNGTVVFDSGKTALTAASGANVTINVAIDSSLKNVSLRWKVKVWDKGDTPSAFSAYNVFSLADTPVVSIVTPPPGLPVDTGSPTFSWAVSIPSGTPQKTATVDVLDAATNALVWHADVVGSATDVTPPVVVLQNSHDYTFTIRVTDGVGLSGSVSGSFTTSYSAPDSITYSVDASGADELGYIKVDLTEALPDDQFAAWKIYRMEVDGAWELIATITDITVRSYNDYMLKAGKRYLYSATQVATRSGTLLESPVGFWLDDADNPVIESRICDVDLTHYWIINPADTTLSTRLLNVIKADQDEAYESETYQIIGRGRHTDYGDRLGYSGTLTCQCRVPERPSTFKQRIEALRRANETYYLRDPFGKLFQVSLGDLSWSPVAGVGTVEFGDLGIPYEEVA